MPGDFRVRGAPLAFDKVPEKLPDWWDEEDDDEDDEKGEGEGGDGGGSGSSSGDGDGSEGGGGGGGGGGGPFAALFAIFMRWMTVYPIRTKAVTTSLLAILGDLMAQRIAQRSATDYVHDTHRTLAIGIWGLIFMGPVLHTWYTYLNRTIVGRLSVLRKVAVDQLLFSPFFNTMFFFGIGALEGRTAVTVFANWRDKIWESMLANWALWPAAQGINFAFVPRPFQVVFVNCVAVFWNAILTFISHRGAQDDIALGESSGGRS